jgi:hypothetical protein
MSKNMDPRIDIYNLSGKDETISHKKYGFKYKDTRIPIDIGRKVFDNICHLLL